MTSAAAGSARCRNGGVRADSAECAPVPSPSGGAVVAMALTRGMMIASKAKAKDLFRVGLVEKGSVESTHKACYWGLAFSSVNVNATIYNLARNII